MWKWITAEDSIGEYPNPYLLLKQSVKEAFDNEWDVFPPGRFRAIHSAGAICRFQIDVAEDSHYTGLLKVVYGAFDVISSMLEERITFLGP